MPVLSSPFYITATVAFNGLNDKVTIDHLNLLLQEKHHFKDSIE